MMALSDLFLMGRAGYEGLPSIGLNMPRYVAAVLSLGLNSAAYISEILRGALGAVPRGQEEAAQVLGLTRSEALIFIVFPQAQRVALPALVNAFSSILKDSSLVSVLSIMELTRIGQLIGVDGSPSCGVDRTCVGYPGGEIASVRLLPECSIVEGRGVFLECLMSMLHDRGVSIPAVGIDEALQEALSWAELSKKAMSLRRRYGDAMTSGAGPFVRI